MLTANECPITKTVLFAKDWIFDVPQIFWDKSKNTNIERWFFKNS